MCDGCPRVVHGHCSSVPALRAYAFHCCVCLSDGRALAHTTQVRFPTAAAAAPVPSVSSLCIPTTLSSSLLSMMKSLPPPSDAAASLAQQLREVQAAEEELDEDAEDKIVTAFYGEPPTARFALPCNPPTRLASLCLQPPQSLLPLLSARSPGDEHLQLLPGRPVGAASSSAAAAVPRRERRHAGAESARSSAAGPAPTAAAANSDSRSAGAATPEPSRLPSPPQAAIATAVGEEGQAAAAGAASDACIAFHVYDVPRALLNDRIRVNPLCSGAGEPLSPSADVSLGYAASPADGDSMPLHRLLASLMHRPLPDASAPIAATRLVAVVSRSRGIERARPAAQRSRSRPERKASSDRKRDEERDGAVVTVERSADVAGGASALPTAAAAPAAPSSAVDTLLDAAGDAAAVATTQVAAAADLDPSAPTLSAAAIPTAPSSSVDAIPDAVAARGSARSDAGSASTPSVAAAHVASSLVGGAATAAAPVASAASISLSAAFPHVLPCDGISQQVVDASPLPAADLLASAAVPNGSERLGELAASPASPDATGDELAVAQAKLSGLTMLLQAADGVVATRPAMLEVLPPSPPSPPLPLVASKSRAAGEQVFASFDDFLAATASSADAAALLSTALKPSAARKRGSSSGVMKRQRSGSAKPPANALSSSASVVAPAVAAADVPPPAKRSRRAPDSDSAVVSAAAGLACDDAMAADAASGRGAIIAPLDVDEACFVASSNGVMSSIARSRPRRKSSTTESAAFNVFPPVSEDGNELLCSVCDEGGDVVCCDSCPASVHTECDQQLRLHGLPAGDVHCGMCIARMRIGAMLSTLLQHLPRSLAGFAATVAEGARIPVRAQQLQTSVLASAGDGGAESDGGDAQCSNIKRDLPADQASAGALAAPAVDPANAFGTMGASGASDAVIRRNLKEQLSRLAWRVAPSIAALSVGRLLWVLLTTLDEFGKRAAAPLLELPTRGIAPAAFLSSGAVAAALPSGSKHGHADGTAMLQSTTWLRYLQPQPPAQSVDAVATDADVSNVASNADEASSSSGTVAGAGAGAGAVSVQRTHDSTESTAASASVNSDVYRKYADATPAELHHMLPLLLVPSPVADSGEKAAKSTRSTLLSAAALRVRALNNSAGGLASAAPRPPTCASAAADPPSAAALPKVGNVAATAAMAAASKAQIRLAAAQATLRAPVLPYEVSGPAPQHQLSLANVIDRALSGSYGVPSAADFLQPLLAVTDDDTRASSSTAASSAASMRRAACGSGTGSTAAALALLQLPGTSGAAAAGANLGSSCGAWGFEALQRVMADSSAAARGPLPSDVISLWCLSEETAPVTATPSHAKKAQAVVVEPHREAFGLFCRRALRRLRDDTLLSTASTVFAASSESGGLGSSGAVGYRSASAAPGAADAPADAPAVEPAATSTPHGTRFELAFAALPEALLRAAFDVACVAANAVVLHPVHELQHGAARHTITAVVAALPCIAREAFTVIHATATSAALPLSSAESRAASDASAHLLRSAIQSQFVAAVSGMDAAAAAVCKTIVSEFSAAVALGHAYRRSRAIALTRFRTSSGSAAASSGTREQLARFDASASAAGGLASASDSKHAVINKDMGDSGTGGAAASTESKKVDALPRAQPEKRRKPDSGKGKVKKAAAAAPAAADDDDDDTAIQHAGPRQPGKVRVKVSLRLSGRAVVPSPSCAAPSACDAALGGGFSLGGAAGDISNSTSAGAAAPPRDGFKFADELASDGLTRSSSPPLVALVSATLFRHEEVIPSAAAASDLQNRAADAQAVAAGDRTASAGTNAALAEQLAAMLPELHAGALATVPLLTLADFRRTKLVNTFRNWVVLTAAVRSYARGTATAASGLEKAMVSSSTGIGLADSAAGARVSPATRPPSALVQQLVAGRDALDTAVKLVSRALTAEERTLVKGHALRLRTAFENTVTASGSAAKPMSANSAGSSAAASPVVPMPVAASSASAAVAQQRASEEELLPALLPELTAGALAALPLLAVHDFRPLERTGLGHGTVLLRALEKFSLSESHVEGAADPMAAVPGDTARASADSRSDATVAVPELQHQRWLALPLPSAQLQTALQPIAQGSRGLQDVAAALMKSLAPEQMAQVRAARSRLRGLVPAAAPRASVKQMAVDEGEYDAESAANDADDDDVTGGALVVQPPLELPPGWVSVVNDFSEKVQGSGDAVRSRLALHPQEYDWLLAALLRDHGVSADAARILSFRLMTCADAAVAAARSKGGETGAGSAGAEAGSSAVAAAQTASASAGAGASPSTKARASVPAISALETAVAEMLSPGMAAATYGPTFVPSLGSLSLSHLLPDAAGSGAVRAAPLAAALPPLLPPLHAAVSSTAADLQGAGAGAASTQQLHAATAQQSAPSLRAQAAVDPFAFGSCNTGSLGLSLQTLTAPGVHAAAAAPSAGTALQLAATMSGVKPLIAGGAAATSTLPVEGAADDELLFATCSAGGRPPVADLAAVVAAAGTTLPDLSVRRSVAAADDQCMFTAMSETALLPRIATGIVAASGSTNNAADSASGGAGTAASSGSNSAHQAAVAAPGSGLVHLLTAAMESASASRMGQDGATGNSARTSSLSGSQGALRVGSPPSDAVAVFRGDPLACEGCRYGWEHVCAFDAHRFWVLRSGAVLPVAQDSHIDVKDGSAGADAAAARIKALLCAAVVRHAAAVEEHRSLADWLPPALVTVLPKTSTSSVAAVLAGISGLTSSQVRSMLLRAFLSIGHELLHEQDEEASSSAALATASENVTSTSDATAAAAMRRFLQLSVLPPADALDAAAALAPAQPQPTLCNADADRGDSVCSTAHTAAAAAAATAADELFAAVGTDSLAATSELVEVALSKGSRLLDLLRQTGLVPGLADRANNADASAPQLSAAVPSSISDASGSSSSSSGHSSAAAAAAAAADDK